MESQSLKATAEANAQQAYAETYLEAILPALANLKCDTSAIAEDHRLGYSAGFISTRERAIEVVVELFRGESA